MVEKKYSEFNVLDIGNKYEIQGVVYGNGEENIILVLASAPRKEMDKVIYPVGAEWNEIIRQSDLLETEVIGADKLAKVILRKSTRNIDTNISWEVFRRDKFTCRYCGADHVPMTVDHVVRWEEGGPSIPMNLVTSCKACNNTQNNMSYEDWLKSPYYIKVSENLWDEGRLRNKLVLDQIPKIKADQLRLNRRSR